MTRARPLLTGALLLCLAPLAASQTTEVAPPTQLQPWEGQFTDSTVTVTLHAARLESCVGTIDCRGALFVLRGRNHGTGALSGSFDAGGKAFAFEARLEGGVLLFQSGGRTYRLPRRPMGAGRADGRNPLTETPGAGPETPPSAPEPRKPREPRKPPAPGQGPDFRHVRPGQRYTFDLQHDCWQVWTVKEVGADFVKYELQLIMGGKPVGDPSPQEWKYMAPVAAAGDPRSEAPDVRITREEVTVSGIQFDCMVTEDRGYKAWASMTPGSDTVWTFPGAIKIVQLSDGEVVHELVKVE